MSENTLHFNVNDPVWFYDINNAPDPHPAPGIVTAVNGETDYDIEITLSDNSIRAERHVGPQEPAVDPEPSPSVRWIELRVIDPGEL